MPARWANRAGGGRLAVGVQAERLAGSSSWVDGEIPIGPVGFDGRHVDCLPGCKRMELVEYDKVCAAVASLLFLVVHLPLSLRCLSLTVYCRFTAFS